jgi:hypothetical protein
LDAAAFLPLDLARGAALLFAAPFLAEAFFAPPFFAALFFEPPFWQLF